MLVIWKDFSTWEPLVVEALTSQRAKQVIAKIKSLDDIDFVDDDPYWFNLLEDNLDCPVDEIEIKLAKKLASQVLRTYHGCRPIDLGSYMSKGLVVHRRDDLIDEVYKLAKSDDRLALLDIDKRIKSIYYEYDQHKSFVTFDDRYMLEYGGQYLIYGSEWLASVLGEENREVLLERGTPTFLLIDIPAEMVSFDTLRGLAKDMLRDWTKQVINGYGSIRMMDSGVELDEDLDPKYIVGHEHPKNIRDPWNSRRIYSVQNKCC
jgi:hypothetical protein